ncbi:probable inactive receptor kinase At5g58300 [Cornus florida]|uniref:probable inactive receptor kinase At5g58300 n=1 Tax=Cornus florida TaxID=4283 RepID=UPI002897696C|nr:probable inactive receptor kinase At5g58300 [Cornus florida]
MGDDDSNFRVLLKWDHTKYFYIGDHSETLLWDFIHSFDMWFGGADQILMSDFGVSSTAHKGLHHINVSQELLKFQGRKCGQFVKFILLVSLGKLVINLLICEKYGTNKRVTIRYWIKPGHSLALATTYSGAKCVISMDIRISNRCEIADGDPSTGFNGAERDALLALKAGFNHPFLNNNWTTNPQMCYMNKTPGWYGIKFLSNRVTGLLLENMGLTGTVKADALVNLTELSVLSFKNNSISGNLMDFSYNYKLTQIDLSRNEFEGPISASLLTLNLLESLQLQDNNLVGSIPNFNQSSLRQFNVSNNHLTGPIPDGTKVLQSFNSSSFSGNPGLCGPPSLTACGNSTSENDTSSSNGGGKPVFSSGLIIINVFAFIVIVLLFTIYCKKSMKLKKKIEKNRNAQEGVQMDEKKIEEGEEEKGKLIFMGGEERFELDDLLKASAEGLGKGNFGNCYKAMLVHGPVVVVKRLRDLRPLTSEEFTGQVQVIADQKHPNLLPLVAYCYSKEEKLLLHRFASKGNLYNRIHRGRGTRDRIPFRFRSRLSVAHSVARALEYLHLNTKSQAIVFHGNLKSTNVLFDENEMVLVSDYGLTTLMALPLAAQRMVSYKSPEYQSHKKVSEKSDVWSYGCLLLELLTGRVSSHSSPQGRNGVDLGSWVHRAVREEWTAEIFDVEILQQRSANHGMLRLLQLAIKCCDKSPEKWPEMGEVVGEIENVKVTYSPEEEDDLSSDRSYTDDSMSGPPSVIIGDER